MILTSFTVGPFAENTFLLEKDGKAIMIDPGFSSTHEWIDAKNSLIDYDLELIAILLTHGHIDHILGVDRVLNEFPVPVYMHPESKQVVERFPQSSAMFGMPQPPVAFTTIDLLPSASFQIGPFVMDVRFTPGHCPGHVSLYFPKEGLVLAGDALFRESIGRTDLPGGNYAELEQSIQRELFSLPDESIVYCGHGPKTTIAHEKAFNPFVRAST